MFASDAEIDSNDNLYIAGSCDNSKETQDNLNESSQSMQNKSYIMKLSDLGDNIWNRSFHGIDCSCENIKISLDNDDNVILSGIYQGELKYDNAVITSTAIGQNNSFIMKIDSDGNFLWAAILEGTGKFSCSSITVALDNTIYCCGNFNGSLASLSNETMTITSGGEDDIFVLSISSSGDILWLNSYGGRLNDQASNITMDNSNIYLTGFFEDSIKYQDGSRLNIIQSIGISDMYILKLKKSGIIDWIKNFGINNAQTKGKGVVVNKNGTVYGIGTIDTILFGITLNSMGEVKN
jgi:hypothetical protein